MTSNAHPIQPIARKHASPHLGVVAVVFVVLFCAGLYPVTAFGGTPYFPSPWEPVRTISAFFQARPAAVALCAFLQFGSAIPLGIFTASIVSRLRFFGIRAAGPNIALFGGFATSSLMLASASVLWTLARPGIALDGAVTEALYYLGYAMGGPGYSVPFGLLLAGISIPLLIGNLVPRWIAIFGIALAIVGELSWLSLELPSLSFLIPLTRFPGFIWMIATGFALPRGTTDPAHGDAE